MDTHPQDFAQKPFDYVIVGGGTVGLALASLLSNDRTVSIGVIEAGLRKDDDLVLIPGFMGQTMGKPEYDWGIKSLPQGHADNREIPMYRGKILGGTSAINYMAFIRGSQSEHDDWVKLGINGWDWNTVVRQVNLSENWTPPGEIAQKHYANNDPENHGRNGFIKTSSHEFYYDITHPFFSCMNNLGIPTNKHTSGGNPIGVWTELASIDPVTRTRSYSANAYYEPIKQRQNLDVLTGAEVLGVNFSSEPDRQGNFRVESVRYKANGKEFIVKCKKEVVLAAGTIQTPAILELSGIGNPDIMKDLGIRNHINLPGVGENLQDHIAVAVCAALSGNHITAEDLSKPEFFQEQLKLYKESQSGMLSATPSSFAYLRVKDFIPKDRLESLLRELDKAIEVSEIQRSPWKIVYEVQRNWLTADNVPQLEIVLFPAYFGSVKSENASSHYTLSLFLQHSWSRGNVHACSLESTIPAVDLAMLNSPADIDAKILIEAIKFAFKITQTEPLASQTLKIIDPSPDSTDEALMDWVRKTVQSAWHPVGTAAMLPRHHNGVVDNELKVYGTSNLRVADASIIPIHIGTHPQAFLYGLAHRAAEIIRHCN